MEADPDLLNEEHRTRLHQLGFYREDDDDTPRCYGCYSKTMEYVARPCGHLVFCDMCTLKYIVTDHPDICPHCLQSKTTFEPVDGPCPEVVTSVSTNVTQDEALVTLCDDFDRLGIASNVSSPSPYCLKCRMVKKDTWPSSCGHRPFCPTCIDWYLTTPYASWCPACYKANVYFLIPLETQLARLKIFRPDVHRTTQCIWCLVEDACSESAACGCLAFCRKCLAKYQKTDLANKCPNGDCLAETTFNVWE